MFLKVKVYYSSEGPVGVAGASPEPSPLVSPVPSPSSPEDEGSEGFSGSFSSPPVSPEDFFSSFNFLASSRLFFLSVAFFSFYSALLAFSNSSLTDFTSSFKVL